IIGSVPWNEDFSIPERHLGLHTASEMTGLREKAQAMADHIDLGFLDDLPDRKFPVSVARDEPSTGKSIWVAQDRAFNFYYADSISSLERMGKVHYFSPLAGEYPENPDLVYLGGGYPELYPVELSENHRLRKVIVDYAESGGNIIAECGGLMYLEKKMETDEGEYPMAGIFKGTVRKNSRLTLGYTRLQALENTILFRKGEIAMGHEFHYSTIEDEGKKALHNLRGRGIDGNDGMVFRNTLGSYSHFSLNRYSKRLQKALEH
ncbi:MAG: cobyrinic acid a,c-diamide synthase, partial [Candidatus Thermoplasmatota archaeon]|nr:cobyrinic acid a,c-diamide synthase [Candidatus Thermoplasmatota archaeon]